jgi:ATP dependent DNA ligase domain
MSHDETAMRLDRTIASALSGPVSARGSSRTASHNRKTDKRANLYSRPGNDLTKRFPSIAEAIARLRSRSCIIDGEAVACGEDWIADFERISAVGPGTHAP